MSTYDMMTPAVRVALRAYVVTLYICDAARRFFRPDQAREVFFACRDNDERLAFVGKVRWLLQQRGGECE